MTRFWQPIEPTRNLPLDLGPKKESRIQAATLYGTAYLREKWYWTPMNNGRSFRNYCNPAGQILFRKDCSRSFSWRRLRSYSGSSGLQEVLKPRNFCGAKSLQMTWTAFFATILNCPLATMIFRLIADGTVSGWSFGLSLARTNVTPILCVAPESCKV